MNNYLVITTYGRVFVYADTAEAAKAAVLSDPFGILEADEQVVSVTLQ